MHCGGTIGVDDVLLWKRSQQYLGIGASKALKIEGSDDQNMDHFYRVCNLHVMLSSHDGVMGLIQSVCKRMVL